MPTNPRQRVADPPAIDRYQTRHGSKLGPRTVSSALRAADIGELREYADLCDELREGDPHLQSVLGKRELQTAGAPFEVKASDATKRAKRIAEVCANALAELVWPVFCSELVSAVYTGRTVLEMVWADRDRYYLPVEFQCVHGRRLRYDSKDWKLRIHDYSVGGGAFAKGPGFDIAADVPGKWIMHTPRVRGGYPQREGLARPVCWYAIFKRWGMRDFVALGEMLGRPLRIGQYNTGTMVSKDGVTKAATPEDKAVLEEALAALGSALYVAIPDTTKIDLSNIAPGHSMHGDLVRGCDEQMSKAVLGETLTTDAGERGARSLGEVHRDVSMMISRYDAALVASTVRRQLFAPIVRENFRPTDAVPTLLINVDPPGNLDTEATRIKTLVDAGFKITQSVVADIFGYPDVDGAQDEVLVPPGKAAASAQGEPSMPTKPTGAVPGAREMLPVGEESET